MSQGSEDGLVRRNVDEDDSKVLLLQEKEEDILQVQPMEPKLKTNSKSTPLLWCDGIRGCASQIVFTFHLQYWFIMLETYTSTWWFRTIRAGNAAVEMFLILSGFVLTVRFFERLQIIERAYAMKDTTTIRNTYIDAYHSIASTGLRRIPRLLGPVVIGAVLSIFITWWRGNSIDLYTLTIDILKTLFIIYPGFNSTLWTLRVELEGSIFTIAFCLILSKLRYRHRIVVCLLAIPVCHNQWGDWTGNQCHYYGSFIIGILLANIITKQKHQLLHGPLPSRFDSSPVFPRTVPNTLGASLESLSISICYLLYHAWGCIHSTWSSTRQCIQKLPKFLEIIVTNVAYIGLFLLGMWLIVYRPEYATEYGIWNDFIHLVFLKEHARMLHRIGSVMILYAVCWSSWLQIPFQSSLVRYWGRISFVLYVVHWPLVLFLGDYVKPWALHQGWSEETCKRFSAAVTYWVAHVIAHICTIYLDEPYVKWLSYMEKRLVMKMDEIESSSSAHVA